MNNFLDERKIISEIVGIIERKLHIVLYYKKKSSSGKGKQEQ